MCSKCKIFHFYEKLLLISKLFAGCFFSFCVFAQEKWTLQACVEYALQRNISIQLAEIDVQQAENQLKQSYYEKMPDINGRASHAYNWGRSIDPFTNQFLNRRIQSNNFSISSTIALFNGFRLHYTIQQNRANVQSSRYALQKAKNELSLSIATLFLQIALQEKQLQNLRNQKQITENQLIRTQSLVRSGSLPIVHETELRAQLAIDETNLVNAENNLELSLLELRQLLHIPFHDPFAIELPTFPEPPEQLTIQTPKEIYEVAVREMPEIHSAEWQKKSAYASVHISKAAFLPTLSFSAGLFTLYSSAQKQKLTGFSTVTNREIIGYFFDSNQTPIPVFQDRAITLPILEPFTFFDQLDQSLRRSLSFDLTIPIFTRYRNRANVVAAQLRAKQADLNEQQVRLQLQQKIERAYCDVKLAHKTYHSNRMRVEATKQNFQMITNRYEAGALPLVEWQNARINLLNAENQLLQAEFDFWFKMKILDFYAGKSIVF
ncbi:MAG: TolC family protein [Cytophagales bacterium]|nr:TolC family protein [Cytophagales bacterium]MDW8383644.1 TolC family protein [Flammeovirgaceae bacterium]